MRVLITMFSWSMIFRLVRNMTAFMVSAISSLILFTSFDIMEGYSMLSKKQVIQSLSFARLGLLGMTCVPEFTGDEFRALCKLIMAIERVLKLYGVQPALAHYDKCQSCSMCQDD